MKPRRYRIVSVGVEREESQDNAQMESHILLWIASEHLRGVPIDPLRLNRSEATKLLASIATYLADHPS